MYDTEGFICSKGGKRGINLGDFLLQLATLIITNSINITLCIRDFCDDEELFLLQVHFLTLREFPAMRLILLHHSDKTNGI